jgi:hypothetical protein
MKLTIERAALLKALGHVQSVVERRNTIPILSNVLLSADEGTLSFSATDLDMEIIDETEAQVSAGGPDHRLGPLPLRHRAQAAGRRRRRAQVHRRRPRLTVRAGRGVYHLPVLPAGDFPVMARDSGRRHHAGGGRPGAADRQDALRHLHRGDALLPERPVPPHRQRRRRPAPARRGHRRPPLALAEMDAPEGRRRARA